MPVTPPFYFSDGVAEYGVVVSIHNRADILERTLSSLLATTLGAWELALVLDACTDGSLAVAQRVLRARTPPCGGENLRRAVVFEVEGRAGHRALFETAADNLGMRMLEPTLAYVLVQPDVVFEERGWNLWLAAALTSDVFAVSARCVVRMDKPKGQRYLSRNQWCAGNRRRPRKAVPEESQFMALVAHHAPRGPLLLRASAMRALGFFDEGCHHLGGDDMELEWLALSRFGWRSAHVYVDVHQLAKAHQNKGGGNGAGGGAPPNTWWRREGVLVDAHAGRKNRTRRHCPPHAFASAADDGGAQSWPLTEERMRPYRIAGDPRRAVREACNRSAATRSRSDKQATQAVGSELRP